MRPKLLELEGFTSFRENTRISFEEVNLFTLTGATGAGKSSVIDALTFALYGSVPRYDNRNLVAPAISQGLEEMRVRLDFEVEGKVYTAARLVRRTRSGATTAEARLESEGKILAGNAEELTARVTSLLGLSFEHFIKCAVLPQGEFARFLHEPAGKRQDLLVELLELEIYQRMGQLANSRQSRLEDEARSAERILSDVYAATTPEALQAAAARIEVLENLQKKIGELLGPWQETVAALGNHQNTAAEIGEQLQSLRGIVRPDGLADLSQTLEKHRSGMEEVSRELLEEDQRLEAATRRLDSVPQMAQLERALERSSTLIRLNSEIERLSEQRKQEELAAQKLEEKLAGADREAKERQKEKEDVLRQHLAIGLARTLEPGTPCPVCDQVVKEVPDKPAPAELEVTEQRLKESARLREELIAEQQRIASRIARLQAQLENLLQQKDLCHSELEGLPDPREAEQLQKQRGQLEAEAARAAARRQTLAERQQDHRTRIAKLADREQMAWKTYHLSVGRLEKWGLPELPPGEDLLASWQRLEEWEQEQTRKVTGKLKILQEQMAELAERQSSLESQLAELGRTGGLEEGTKDPLAACSLALAEARSRHLRLDEDLNKARTLQKEVRKMRADAETARELATLLNARNFERWYLNRALQKLVQGASQILRQLTREQYSLAVDEKSNFEVLDHANAHERRLAKTLSGGETFLASLALALALSEHVAELSVRGAAPLEALFLDEGFGTLDDETLDVVACALEELGAGGRMVGIVTHVRELARRMPVRFEVCKEGGTSRVERVES